MPLPLKRSDSLSTQRKGSPSPTQMFLELEDELRDVRRVHSYGLEDDLRQALEVVVNRVVDLVRCAVFLCMFASIYPCIR
jgi:hypothetical protein